jgi:hypothetical protein
MLSYLPKVAPILAGLSTVSAPSVLKRNKKKKKIQEYL